MRHDPGFPCESCVPMEHLPPEALEQVAAYFQALFKACADLMLGIDTGCVTTMDKNQWIGKAHEKRYSLPIMAVSSIDSRRDLNSLCR